MEDKEIMFATIDETYMRGKDIKLIEKVNKNGFEVEIHKINKEKRYIICFNGTNDPIDWASDFDMYFKKIPKQYEHAKSFLDNLEKTHGIKTSQIEMITGHSLGGSLAQMIGRTKEYSHIKVITYNAFGTKDIEIPNSGEGKNITNYISENDIIANLEEQVGKNENIPIGEKAQTFKKYIRFLKEKEKREGINYTSAINYCILQYILFSHSEELESKQNEPIPDVEKFIKYGEYTEILNPITRNAAIFKQIIKKIKKYLKRPYTYEDFQKEFPNIDNELRKQHKFNINNDNFIKTIESIFEHYNNLGYIDTKYLTEINNYNFELGSKEEENFAFENKINYFDTGKIKTPENQTKKPIASFKNKNGEYSLYVNYQDTKPTYDMDKLVDEFSKRFSLKIKEYCFCHNKILNHKFDS